MKLPRPAAASSENMEPTAGYPPPPSREEIVLFSEEIPQSNFLTARRVWELLMLSLPLDCFFLTLAPIRVFEPLASYAFVLSIIAALFIFIRKGELLLWSVRLKELQMGILARNRWLPYTILALVLSLSFIEILLKLGSMGRGAVIAAGIATLLSISAFVKAMKERRQGIHRYASEWTERMRVGNSLIFGSSIVGMAASRLSALSGWYLASSWHEGVLVSLLGAVLLISLMPRKDDFFFACPHCGKWSSRALGAENKCGFCRVS